MRGPEISTRLSSHEQLERIKSEGWRPKKGLRIGIYGQSGSGKGRLSEGLQELYGIEPYKGGGGDKVRVDAGLARGFVGFIPRDIEVDRRMDQEQLEYLLNYRNDPNPKVVESRLFPIIAYEARQIDPNIPTVSILVRAGWRARAQRIQKRALSDLSDKLLAGYIGAIDLRMLPNEIGALVSSAWRFAQSDLTQRRVREQEEDREKKDMELWRIVHPQALSTLIDIFALDARTPDGKLLYDFNISTSNGSIDETRLAAHNFLKANGFLERPGQLPTSADIYQARGAA